MSKDEDQVKHSKRLHRAWTAIKKQLKIACTCTENNDSAFF